MSERNGVPIGITMPRDLLRIVDEVCAREDFTRSQLIRKALRRELEFCGAGAPQADAAPSRAEEVAS